MKFGQSEYIAQVNLREKMKNMYSNVESLLSCNEKIPSGDLKRVRRSFETLLNENEEWYTKAKEKVDEYKINVNKNTRYKNSGKVLGETGLKSEMDIKKITIKNGVSGDDEEYEYEQNKYHEWWGLRRHLSGTQTFHDGVISVWIPFKV